MAKKKKKKKTALAKGSVIHCKYDKLVDPKKLKAHPANPAMHPDSQIELLAKIIKAHGVRHPIIVSKRSGFIVAGHCRCSAALLLKMPTYPVVFQDYASEAEELAVLVADNKIAELSETNGSMVGDIIVELDQQDYPLVLTALNESQIQYYVEGPLEPYDPDKDWTDMPEFDQDGQEGCRKIIVHFAEPDDVTKFAKAIGQIITEKCRFIWYPAQPKVKAADKQYKSEKEQ